MNTKLESFSVRDQKLWDRSVANNQSDYGACGMRYCARWAHAMEAEMSNGKKLEDIAEETSHTADTEGITGFMYGCAVSTLGHVWKHGEALRRWHNIKTQLGTEGEMANEKGGTLNPACLNIEL